MLNRRKIIFKMAAMLEKQKEPVMIMKYKFMNWVLFVFPAVS